MNIKWEITNTDIQRVHSIIAQNDNAFLAKRIEKNVNGKGIVIDKNSILKGMIACLLTTQQRSGPNSAIHKFLLQTPFPITFELINNIEDIQAFVHSTFENYGLNRYINRISRFFLINYKYLEYSDWELIQELTILKDYPDKQKERSLADKIDRTFSGFGPKQSRNLLQILGLSKYEIPIDSRIMSWLNKFGFPIKLTAVALQDAEYYHFICDGVQELCDKANTYPCLLDAAIFSSSDAGNWTIENTVY